MTMSKAPETMSEAAQTPDAREAADEQRPASASSGGLARVPRVVGYWEEYGCGCVSDTERRKRDLVGYCPRHGNDRRHVHREYAR